MSYGCNGGYPYYALELLKEDGAPKEESHPYQPSASQEGICNVDEDFVKIPTTVNEVKRYYNSGVAQMEQYLADHGPYQVGVRAGHQGFFSTANGIVLS